MATQLVNGSPGALRAGTGGPSGFGGGRATPPDPAAMAAIRARAATVLPAAARTPGTTPNLRTLERDFQGDAAAGRKVFETDGTCAACHSLGGQKKLGPDLSAIGEKFGKQGLLKRGLIVGKHVGRENQYEITIAGRRALASAIWNNLIGKECGWSWVAWPGRWCGSSRRQGSRGACSTAPCAADELEKRLKRHGRQGRHERQGKKRRGS